MRIIQTLAVVAFCSMVTGAPAHTLAEAVQNPVLAAEGVAGALASEEGNAGGDQPAAAAAEASAAAGEASTAAAMPGPAATPAAAAAAAITNEAAAQAGPPVPQSPLAPGLALPSVDGRPKAPDFTLRTLSGQRVKLSDYQGKVVLLSFWATWCAPCKQELPVLQTLLDRHGRNGDLEILAINTDDPKTVAEVRRFVADRKLTMPIPLDGDSKVLGRFNPRHALPFLQILDHEGRRVFQHTGFTSGAEKILEEQVLALLGEKPTKVATP